MCPRAGGSIRIRIVCVLRAQAGVYVCIRIRIVCVLRAQAGVYVSYTIRCAHVLFYLYYDKCVLILLVCVSSVRTCYSLRTRTALPVLLSYVCVLVLLYVCPQCVHTIRCAHVLLYLDSLKPVSRKHAGVC